MEANTEAEFNSGVSDVKTLLRNLGPDGREARRKRWVDTYAKGAGIYDFNVVMDRVFNQLGGYDKKERDLQSDIARL
jgi:hypothetical protein